MYYVLQRPRYPLKHQAMPLRPWVSLFIAEENGWGRVSHGEPGVVS